MTTNQPTVNILQVKGSQTEVKSQFNPTIWHLIETIKGTTWDAMKSCYLMPNESVDGFIELLNTNSISYNAEADQNINNMSKY